MISVQCMKLPLPLQSVVDTIKVMYDSMDRRSIIFDIPTYLHYCDIIRILLEIESINCLE